jgi:phosphoribosylglycinamide formyltransferase-1
MKNIVILISGRGSNMEAIVRACESERWSAKISAVISNRPEASGLQFAAQKQIANIALDHRAYASRAAFDAALAQAIDAFAPDFVVLAGFMRILTPEFVQRYVHRLLNIHPSLLPAFPGLHTHAKAIEHGCKVAGATVHFVTDKLDHGPIVIQAIEPIQPQDTPEALALRVLKKEHIIYPRALRWAIEDRLDITPDGRVVHRDGAEQLYF